MKTFVRILMLFLAVNLSAFLCFGQNISHLPPQNKQSSVKINKNLLPPGFMAGLKGLQFVKHTRHFKTTHGFTFHIDTAIVYSNYVNPQRYTYTYDSAGNQTTSLIALATNEKWENVSMDTATYDSVDNKLISVSKVWTNGRWVNASKKINTYVINHHILTSTGYIWVTDHWEYSDSSHFTYDVNGNKVASYSAVWSDTASTWINRNFHLFAYDTVGNLKLSLSEKWMDSLWMDAQRVTYSYDSASNLISGLVQNRGDTSWVNFYQEKYTYDSVRNRTSYVGQMWNDSVWVNDQQYFYTYDGSRRLSESTGQVWNDSISAWVNYEKAQYTYDTYNGLETNLYQQWNDTVWANVSLSQYNYDTAGNAVSGNFYTADTTGNWLQNDDGVLQIYYNYSSIVAYFTGYQVNIKYNTPLSTGVNDGMKEVVSRYTLAPNPAINHTTVSIGMKVPENVNMSLYNITGEKILNLFQGTLSKGVHRFNIPTSQLPSGLYFVSFLSGKQTKTIKLIVRK